jgi:hypothetical protein
MQRIAFLMLMITIGGTFGYAHQTPIPVKMTFSGNAALSPANLQQPDSSTGEENVAGKSSLGSFTFRNINAEANSPSPSNSCSGANQAYFKRLSGGGLFRFEDGSLLKVSLVAGGDCIDFSANEGHCTLTLQVTGGTGRFKGASGTLTYTETATPVVLDANNNPLLFTEVGEVTGTIAGPALEQQDQSDKD